MKYIFAEELTGFEFCDVKHGFNMNNFGSGWTAPNETRIKVRMKGDTVSIKFDNTKINLDYSQFADLYLAFKYAIEEHDTMLAEKVIKLE